MKLSIEEKARAYDEAIKKIKYVIEHGVSPVLNKEDLQDLFQELNESEDERVRKELIELLNDLWEGKQGLMTDRKDYERYTAWLEKQGEQKPFDYENANIQQKGFAPKQEPKFKVGDWVVCGQFITQIFEIVNDGYVNSHRGFISFNDAENYHLWTIQDAKDGDVLAAGDWVCIFRKIHINGFPKCHCHYDLTLEEFKVDTDFYMACGGNIYPATKEQRDLLFEKMSEAGYMWDADRKELCKIEHETKWTEEDEKVFNNLIGSLIRISHHTFTDCTSPNYTFFTEIEWLKELKQRME